MQTTKKNQRHAVIVLSLLFVLFVVPFLSAWVIEKFFPHISAGRSNHGHLIQPALPISSLKLSKTNQKKWRLLVFNAQHCGHICQRNLHNLQQIRLATGKYQQRVAPGLLKTNPIAKKCPFPPNSILIIDPQGNAMMYYAANANPDNILLDLKHLLKVSKIG